MRRPALLSIDVEDWHQLVHRRLGRDDWDRARPEFPRQMAALFEVLDDLGARPTMFLLGMTVERYPEVVREIAERGHEVGSHGYAHRRVYTQSEAEFRDDLKRSIDSIGEATGKRPAGYRAAEFSINRDTPWAYDVLAELGFRYDSSQHHNRRIPNRIEPASAAPYRIELPSGRTLWELPTPSVRRVPVGGGAYWRLLPAPVLVRALASVPWPVLYFHPYEFDPLPLRAELPDGLDSKQRLFVASRRVLRNPGRGLIAARLRKVADHFRLTSYEEAHDEIEREYGASTRALSPQGVLV
ncbi:MAG: polysaccharide deacetylase family protein [Actinobacteria bacterium]|nr:polysaccharide deacetylase family protein [Actinomycetota bacterium]